MKNARAATTVETSAQLAPDEAPFGFHSPNAVQQFLIKASRNTLLRRGHLRKIMSRVIRKLGHENLDISFRDARYRIGNENNIIEYGLLLDPKYNVPDIEFLSAGLRPGGVFVDVGSNIGMYSLPLAKKVGPTGAVVAIDANPLMAQRLEQNAMFSEATNVKMFCCGVSDFEGMASLQIRHDDVAIVNIVNDPEGKVEVRTLESVIGESGVDRVDCLKIDIEGLEDRALVPYLSSVQERFLPDRIVIEHLIEDGWVGCKAKFGELGYRLVGRTKTNALYQRGE